MDHGERSGADWVSVTAICVKPPARRLAFAARHLELAIANINDVTQAAVLTGDARSADAEELRLMVMAIADIRNELRRLAAVDLFNAS